MEGITENEDVLGEFGLFSDLSSAIEDSIDSATNYYISDPSDPDNIGKIDGVIMGHSNTSRISNNEPGTYGNYTSEQEKSLRAVTGQNILSIKEVIIPVIEDDTKQNDSISIEDFNKSIENIFTKQAKSVADGIIQYTKEKETNNSTVNNIIQGANVQPGMNFVTNSSTDNASISNISNSSSVIGNTGPSITEIKSTPVEKQDQDTNIEKIIERIESIEKVESLISSPVFVNSTIPSIISPNTIIQRNEVLSPATVSNTNPTVITNKIDRYNIDNGITQGNIENNSSVSLGKEVYSYSSMINSVNTNPSIEENIIVPSIVPMETIGPSINNVRNQTSINNSEESNTSFINGDERTIHTKSEELKIIETARLSKNEPTEIKSIPNIVKPSNIETKSNNESEIEKIEQPLENSILPGKNKPDPYIGDLQGNSEKMDNLLQRMESIESLMSRMVQIFNSPILTIDAGIKY